MSAWAKPGVKCVCVDGGDKPALCTGAVYEIIGLKEFLGRLYVEVDVKPDVTGDRHYLVARFRPLITLDQDIALFAHHLDGVGVPA